MRSSLGSRFGAILAAATLSTLVVACGGQGSAIPSAPTRTAEATVATPVETAAEGGAGGNFADGATATIELRGETLEFHSPVCFGAPDNFAFVGSSADNRGSFEIQATTDATQQRVRVVVDEVFLGGEISTIEVGSLHASGSATLDDGATFDFEVSCPQ